MKKEYIDFIASFLKDRNVFFGKVNDDGIFDKHAFNEYGQAVYQLSKLELTKDEKYLSAITMWEISFQILSLLDSHSDPNDYFLIENLEEDDKRQIYNILHYTANWFSYNKEMKETHLKIGSWV